MSTQKQTNLSFEEALRELEASVRQLEEGSLPLEKSIDVFEKGVQLSHHCEKKLQEANLKIKKITLDDDGAPIGLKPLDAS